MTDPDDLFGRLNALRPKLRMITLQGIGAALGVTALALVVLYADSPGDPFDSGFLFHGCVFSVIINIWIARWTKRRREALVLPHIAREAGFSYDKKISSFRGRMPPALLPKGSVHIEDHVKGTIADKTVEMAEITVDTRSGKSRRTLFRGIVVRFDNLRSLPSFSILPVRMTNTLLGGIFGNWIEPKGMSLVESLRDEKLAVWTDGDPVALRRDPVAEAVLNELLDWPFKLPGHAQLFSVVSDGSTLTVALSYSRDLFSLGNIFATTNQMLKNAQQAAQDFEVPIRLVEAVLKVEQSALNASPADPVPPEASAAGRSAE